MLTPDIRALFELLPGQWQLQRVVPENNATMTGTAQFEAAARDVLAYHETGIMKYEHGPHGVERRYRYELGDDGILTYFADGPDAGKLFERLTFAPSSSGCVELRGDHLCAQDRYDTTYTFADDDHFTIVHKVEGPAKKYVMTTRYSRLSSQP